jgi:hypothetical protein
MQAAKMEQRSKECQSRLDAALEEAAQCRQGEHQAIRKAQEVTDALLASQSRAQVILAPVARHERIVALPMGEAAQGPELSATRVF